MKTIQKHWKWVLLICAVLMLTLGIVACNDTGNTSKEVTFEAQNLNVKLGSEVNWTAGVKAKTSDGKEVQVTADASKVNMQQAGTYPITFTAGNYSIERIVRVYGMPSLYYAGEAIADNQTFEMTYADLMGERGFASGITAKDCFGITLGVEAEAPEYTGGAGPFSVKWKTQDAAGNVLTISGTVTLNAEKFPSAQDTTYDFAEEYAEILADAKGSEQVFLFEGESKINLKYYEETEEGFLLSGAYLSKGETGKREFRIETEYGVAEFSVEVTDSNPVNLDNIFSMDGYMFLEGQPISIELPERLGSGYQQFDVEYKCDTLTFELTSEAFEVKGAAPIGDHTVTVTATGKNNVAEESFVIKVCGEEEYLANYGPGSADQFTDRFMVDVNSGVKFGFERLDKDVYGVSGAYRFTAPGVSAWNQRLEMRLTTTDIDVSQYDTVEFDVWVNSGNATFPFFIVNPSSYIAYTVVDLETQQTVEANAVQAGRWYHFTAAVPANAGSYATCSIILANNNETTDLYIRNIAMCRTEAVFQPLAGSNATFGMDPAGIAGRENVYKYTSAVSAYDGRVQFTKWSYNEYCALSNAGGGTFSFDVCLTGELKSLQFWYIQNGTMSAFASADSTIATWKDSEGNVLTEDDLVAETWYTLEISVSALGALEVNDNGDRGLQVAANMKAGGVFYVDNVQFIPAA